jgi:hypothetical protein
MMYRTFGSCWRQRSSSSCPLRSTRMRRLVSVLSSSGTRPSHLMLNSSLDPRFVDRGAPPRRPAKTTSALGAILHVRTIRTVSGACAGRCLCTLAIRRAPVSLFAMMGCVDSGGSPTGRAKRQQGRYFFRTIGTMRWFRTIIATAFVGLAIPAAAAGPQAGDSCSAWVVCPGGTASSGTYPACVCGPRTQRRNQTCEADFACAPPGVVSGTWPDCVCDQGTPRGPICGRCEIEFGHQCVPVTCRF